MIEIQERLSLYQIFLKLYEHNRTLLDELLQAENIGHQSLGQIIPQHITGVVQNNKVYLITNLIQGKTQQLIQSQGVWILGRGSYAAISIADDRLSRTHAVIQYIHNEGFYLCDLNSTNGTFINNESVYEPVLLKDGDRIRLGSMTFSFFLCNETQQIDQLPNNVLKKLSKSTLPLMKTSLQSKPKHNKDQKVTDIVFKNNDPISDSASHPKTAIIREQKAKILDRFFQKDQRQKQ
jgi:pSer/pThr/pTyr-binding forkhead associated (FHA) protein